MHRYRHSALFLLPLILVQCDSDNGVEHTPVPNGIFALNNVVTGDSDGRIVGYLAHLYGHSIGDSSISLLGSAEVTNAGAEAKEVVIEVQIPGYTEKARHSAVVPGFGSVTVPSITPAFNFDRIYSVATSASANLDLNQAIPRA